MENYQELHIEQDFWNDFILEAVEHLEDIETNVITLEQNPEDMEIIHTMFRAFHTIKGLSGFVEHTIIQEIAHKTETLMDFCRKGELGVNSKIVDAILKSADYIRRLCEDIESYKDQSFIAQIEVLLQNLEELAAAGENPAAAPAAHEPVHTETSYTIEEDGSDLFDIPEEPPVEEKAKEGLAAFAEEISKAMYGDDSEKTEEKSSEAEEQAEQPETVEAVEAEPEIETASEETTTAPVEVEAEIKEEIKEETKQEPIKEIKPEPPVIEVKPEKIQPEPVKATTATLEKEEVKVEAPEAARKIIPSNEEYMKVANYKIDHLVDMIGELIINQSLIEQYITSNYSGDNKLITNMSGFLRITRELQNLSMSLRMVSLKPTFQKVSRIARDTIQELGKNVEFTTSGEGTEIDRVVTDKLLDPLVHLIKNAISHGVEEDVQDRVKIGKNPKARVELNAFNKRGKIFIQIKDDGRGINTEVVYQKALEKGLVDPNKTYSEEEIREFIMLPGFSTAKVVDNISGRGVGMDVVKTQILKIGGKVNIESELNKGSSFTLEVPVNHAIMNGTVVEMDNGQYFIIPTINVKEILQPEEKQWIFTQQKRTMIRVRDDIISLIPTSVFFKGEKLSGEVPLVIILELDGELKALPIKNVINRQEVVVKPVGEEFAHLKFISGMSILGTGRVSLILDIDYLFKKEVKE